MLHSAHIVRRRLTRDSRSVSCKASNRRLECASVLLVLVRAQARIASKLSMPCSSTCSHEDHARHHAVQAGSHAVHVDGRLRQPSTGCTLEVADGQPDLLSKNQRRSTMRHRWRYNPTSGMRCRRGPSPPMIHRTVDDTSGLTFKPWQAKKGEVLVVNSSELRAVQGHQKNDFVLRAINPPKQREWRETWAQQEAHERGVRR